MLYMLASLLGILAGSRVLLAPAAVAWAMRLGRIGAHGGRLAFFAHRCMPWVLSLLALGELAIDQLPSTPRRTAPLPFTARIASGALCGTTIGTPGHALAGALLGAAGAVIGTRCSAAARAHLARGFLADRPAALVENMVAVATAAMIVALF
jgi:uncharacterized membrane protein